MAVSDSTIVKKKLFASYIAGIFDQKQGEGYATIISYFLPEFITALLIYSLLYLVDVRWIAALQSTNTYATIGSTNTLLHFIMKVAEGFSIGTVVMVGNFNGQKQYKKAGRALTNAFWLTALSGALVALFLYMGARSIYTFYGLPEKMIEIGVPFLRLKSISVFFMFVYFAIVGFLRGIKRPKIAMYIFILGAITFLFFDYALIFGSFGFSQLGVLGSAWASIVQHVVMLTASLCYILYTDEVRQYAISLFRECLEWQYVKELWQLSWPIMLDKGLLAGSYLWLGAMINPMGKYAIASYTVIKDLERVAILPASAFAQVITYLVSNVYALHDWNGIKSTIKKTVFLASVFVFLILVVFSLWPTYFIALFDPKNKFTTFAAQAFPILSFFVFFDLLQLILAGALRGAKNVRTVMVVRFIGCVGYFIPIAWFLSNLSIESSLTKFLLVYGSFYIGNGLMSIVYIDRFRGQTWKKLSNENG